MSDNPSETRNYLRFIAVFVDVGTEQLLKLFYHHKPRQSVKAYLSSGNIRSILQKELSKWQYRIVTLGNAEEFDISILITLLNILFDTSPVMKADLKRLKSMRNKIVAHRKKAALTPEESHRNFSDLKIILGRITDIFHPDEKVSLARKIEAYRTMELDMSQKDMYLAKISKWHDDLQEKVKELMKKENDLQRFFKSVDDKYTRYIRLLLDAGPLVLTAYLNEAIGMQQQTFVEFLLHNRELLQTELCNQDVFKQLYPGSKEGESRPNTDINTWDLFVLAKVILVVFGRSMKRKERRNIEGIMKAKENYAAKAVEALDRDKFSHCCEDLIHNIKSLAEDLGEDVESECEEFISTYRSEKEDRYDLDEYMKKLKCHDSEIVTLAEIHEEHIRILRQAIEETDDAKIDFKQWPEIEVKIQIVCEDAEKRKQAEVQIEETLGYTGKEMDRGQGIPALLEIRRNIENIPSAHLVGVKQKSILLAVRCQSKQSLLQLIDYIDGHKFQENLIEVAVELEDMFDEAFFLQGYFTFESLRNAHPDNFKPQQDEGIVLPIACSSPEERQLIKSGVLYQEESSYRRENKYGHERTYSSEKETKLGLSQEFKKAELENTRLKEKLDKCKQECEHSISVLKEENANLKTEIAKLGSKLATEEQKFHERMSEMERRTLRQQQEKLDVVRGPLKALHHENIILDREKRESERLLREAERRISVLEKENSNMEKSFDQVLQYKKKVEDLEVDNEDLRTLYYYEKRAELEKLRSEELASNTTTERTSLDRSLCKVEEDDADLATKVQNLQAQLAEAEQRHSQRLMHLTTGRRTATEMQAERLRQAQKVKAMEETIAALQDRLATDMRKGQQYI